MENVITDKYKSLRCIVWTVQSISSNKTVVSETFLFQDQNCNLNFYPGPGRIFTVYPYLNFKCDGELQLPVPVSIRVISNSEILDHLSTSITGANQKIWNYTKVYELLNRRLTFELIFHVDSSIDEKSVQTPSYINNYCLTDSISQDFSKMFSEGPCHDVEFVCGDQTIKAHKSVLCCRSDVFASMLQNDMVEGKTGRVNIQDMDATLFRQFLRCLYTGILPPLTVDIAVQFYEAGDKYNISSLKKQCADFLVDNLLTGNAYEILILADRHNDPDLKKTVIDYMIKKQIPYTGEKWTDFCKENPFLANEILNLFCQHRRPK